ncbi:bis(5'-nucleosyl)-tetraphosphatase (symmetrical) [Massilia sp. Root418]|jgi:bis(5'-nucleosyl)-tetraphosphatase (symmetrical)|uniref:symmetrical bis(5'-nucleosyl)-tetraphosphatase n=1 Tax=Massilia sp. Root418 TaxID=1736532 RepID=UPI0006FC7433|nr:symmetrical bis(5'-nucleosyl)-tetraphosphatase [Massilia sp. Root418]KQW96422.1 bis(5'-nucleosyl)-tetraphosphatase (symmetrical) [Massilia sp. Root418]
MKTYVIGDLQGCHDQTVALVDRILAQEQPAPSILFTGDLINRGPDSLATLRYVYALAVASGGRIDTVLGNHDLHLLAVASGIRPASGSDTLEHILEAPDGAELLDWLRTRPMAMLRKGHLLVHGGVLPQWDAAQVMALAGEVEAALRGPAWAGFLAQMYGNEPDAWNDELHGPARLRCIVNALTRLRFCSMDGVMDFKLKESAKADPASGLMPWFEVPGRRTQDVTVVFGHWSALGLMLKPNLIALDTGCVWGGYLSAVCLDDRSLMQVQCPEYREHSGKK